jgi:hypothetical protein
MIGEGRMVAGVLGAGVATRGQFLQSMLLRTFLYCAAALFAALATPPIHVYFVAMIAFAYPPMAARMRAFKASPVWLVAAVTAIFLALWIGWMIGVRPMNDQVPSGKYGEEFIALFYMALMYANLPIAFLVLLTVGLILPKTAPDAKPSRRPVIASLAYLAWIAGLLFGGPILVGSATNLICAQNRCAQIWSHPLSPVRIDPPPS